jgi:hypothetical protein
MVMLSYASVHRHAFLDRELYLHESWTSDRARCRDAGCPTNGAWLPSRRLGIAMLSRALADAALRYAWLVADSGYGRDPALPEFCHNRAVP